MVDFVKAKGLVLGATTGVSLLAMSAAIAETVSVWAWDPN